MVQVEVVVVRDGMVKGEKERTKKKQKNELQTRINTKEKEGKPIQGRRIIVVGNSWKQNGEAGREGEWGGLMTKMKVMGRKESWIAVWGKGTRHQQGNQSQRGKV